MNLSYLFLTIYIVSSTMFNESYKLIAKNMDKAGSLTVLVETIAGILSLLLIPFFEIKFPSDIRIFLLFFLATIFYTIQDRLATISRSGLEASTYGILKQLSNVFMLVMGFIYISLTLLIPALINSLVEKIKFTNLRYEYKINKSRLILLTGILWSVMMFSKLLSYRFGEVTKIAPLCSLSVMLNVIVAYVFFKERDNLLRKIIASIFIIIGVFLIK